MAVITRDSNLFWASAPRLCYTGAMPRLARIVVAGAPHHITQRGNNQQDVFFVDDDRRVYLQFLREYAARYRFRIHDYRLMANPPPAGLRSRCVRYGQYVNQFHRHSGHTNTPSSERRFSAARSCGTPQTRRF